MVESKKWKTFMLDGVPREYDAINLKRALRKLRVGRLLQVRVPYEKGGSSGRGLAFVLVQSAGCSIKAKSILKMSDKRVVVKDATKPDFIKFDHTKLFDYTVVHMALGFAVDFESCTYMTVPYQELDSSVKLKMRLDMERKRLYFTYHIGKDRYKIEVFLSAVTSGVKISERGRACEVSFVSTSVPLIYRYDDESREKLWQWNLKNDSAVFKRTCGLSFERPDPFVKFLVKNLAFKIVIVSDAIRDLRDNLDSLSLLEERWIDIGPAAVVSPMITSDDLIDSNLPFSVKYLLLCHLSHCYFNVFTLTPSVLDYLATQCRENLPYLEFCLEKLFFDYDCLKLVSVKNPQAAIQDKLLELRGVPLPRRDRENYGMIRTVFATPVTQYFLPPHEEVKNRITRKYAKYNDYFLRLKFVDENLNRVLKYSNELLNRVKRLLRCYEIFDREYVFLAFSSSQLRAQSVLMYSGTEVSAEAIRSWIGDVSHIRNAAKYSARLGQCLAASVKVNELTPEQIIYIDDILTDDEKYNFSDGIGYIHHVFFRSFQPDPCISAVQFRLGGIKGVLAINPEAENQDAIYIRPSMSKFSSPCYDLEVLNYAEFRFGYLNRQFILLMNSLGVDERVFIELLDIYLEKYRMIFTDSEKARHVLTQHNTEDVRCLMLDRAIEMVDAGFTVKEPFLQEVLKAAYIYTIMEIKRKQRILVDDAACLMGVMDETNTLEYEQVFVQTAVRDRYGLVQKKVFEGRVVVSKNPCMHPGDILVLTAVYVDDLSHLTNVIVFPSKGPRPHPNEVSGSDLDGDLYFVSDNPKIIPGERVKSLEYGTTGSVEYMDRVVTVDDIIDFVADYYENDNLGAIANAHLAIADLSENGPNDPRCLELCSLHSHAVDFPKTGQPAYFPADLKPEKWPHYMEHKEEFEKQRSTGVIGKLYDHAKEFSLQGLPKIKPDGRLMLPDDSHCQAVAYEIFKAYQAEIVGHMALHSIESEAALLTGECESFSKYFLNKIKRREEVKLKLNLVTIGIMEKAREAFDAAVETGLDRTLLASACYRIGVAERFYGFPWVVGFDELKSLVQAPRPN